MRIAWVVGAGGMLGSALCHALAQNGVSLYRPAERIDWENHALARAQLEAAALEFSALVERSSGADWQVYWAAGVGTMASGAASMRQETQLLDGFLAGIAAAPQLMRARGILLLASTAGAIYAGCDAEVITEYSAIAPTTDYACGKLEQERLVSAFAATHPNSAAVIARISTLYGPRSTAGKLQGLVAEMARRVVRNQPINIFVPLDTIRDYIAVDDAADLLVAWMQSACGGSGSETRIIASGQATTISEIVATFKKIAHRMPRISTSGSHLAALYRRRIQFRSLRPIAPSRPPTSLVIGISRVLAAERRAFALSSEAAATAQIA